MKTAKLQFKVQEEKPPSCIDKKNNIVRICCTPDCKNANNSSLICGNIDCKCEKETHQKCISFLNYHYIKSLIDEYSTSIKDFYEPILRCLEKSIRQLLSQYNKIQQQMRTFMMSPEIKDYKKSINEGQLISKKISLNLSEFVKKWPKFEVKVDQELKKQYRAQTDGEIQKITKVLTEFSKYLELLPKQYEQKLMKSIEKNNESKLQLMKK